jgi:serine phosphatase RsbU (regulator of sigma subunit)
MTRNNKESIIDRTNEKIWSGRFGNFESIQKLSFQNLRKAESAQYQKGIAYSKLNLASVNFLNSRNDAALEYLKSSLLWFKENTHDQGYVRAILLEGNIFESFGDYERTLSLWLEAYKISKETMDKESEAEASSQLGLVYSRLGNYRKALDYFNTGLSIREAMNDENAVASSLNRIGMVHRQMKKYDESLEFYLRSLEIRKKNRQLSAIPWTLLGIATTYENSGKTDEALDYFLKGSSGGDPRCVLQCMTGAGRIYSLNGENKLAEKMLKGSLGFALELKASSLIADAYSALAKHYESIGKDSLALRNFKLFQQTRESLLNEESQSRLRNIEVSHAIEKSEQEKEIFRLRNVELKEAYEIIEEKNKDITASISYARRIQNAILPKTSDFQGLSGKLFILYMPKDIVSGDFYWFTKLNGKFIIAAGDCTGHGVPGALMSMLGISFLEEIVNKREILSPGAILDELSNEVKRALHQKGDNSEAKDGMDISLCVIDIKNNSIRFSAANNNLYLVRENQLTEYKADRMGIGFNDANFKKFSEQEIIPHPNDILYLYSDGYADQFGGPNNKKFKYSTLKDSLIRIHKLPLKEQKSILEKEFLSWKGEYPQVDDVLIIGMKF